MFNINKRYKPESKIIDSHLCVTTFKSLSHFMNYIEGDKDTVSELDTLSKTNSLSLTGTSSYEEAKELLINGYDIGTEILKQTIQSQKTEEDKIIRKIVSDVVGYQPVVPNYLMGLPNSMLNNKLVTKKQKVITINKCIDFSYDISMNEIIQSSARTIRIIKTLESKGFSVNLNIIDGSRTGYVREVVKIRLKNAGESFNLKKLSFPLMHPSMLRRMMFRYSEVSNTSKDRCMNTDVYASCVEDSIYLELCKESGEIFINRLISEEVLNNTTKLVIGELQK